MSAQTYTPTHCPETGRKLTRAERRAANKAKFAQEQAAKRKSAKPKTTKPKAKAKTAKQSRADVLCKQYGLTMEQMFDIMDACQSANTYTPVDVQEDDTTPPAPNRTKRKTKNDKLEAQAQRLSNRASAKRNARKTEVVCDNKPTAASPFGTRTEVDAPAPKAKAQRPADYTPPTPISVLREAGYTDVMDMLRAVNMDMMDGGVTADDIL